MYLHDGQNAGMMTLPPRNPSLPASPFLPFYGSPFYTPPPPQPSAQLSALAFDPIAERIAQFNDWWVRWVSSSYSDWDASVDAVRQRYNEWIDDPEVAYPTGTDPNRKEFNKQRDLLVERYGDCYTAWYVWPSSQAGSGCTHDDEVANVLRCYNNLVRAGTIPEFYYASTTNEQRTVMYRQVATCSGVDYEKVWPILVIAKSLFDTTGKVHVSVMYPLAWEAQKTNRKTSQSEDTITGWLQRTALETGVFLGDFVSFLKWAVIVGGIAFAGYYGYKIFIEKESYR
jgi:hypothetical protein